MEPKFRIWEGRWGWGGQYNIPPLPTPCTSPNISANHPSLPHPSPLKSLEETLEHMPPKPTSTPRWTPPPHVSFLMKGRRSEGEGGGSGEDSVLCQPRGLQGANQPGAPVGAVLGGPRFHGT